jgi:hypothetical protein
MKKNLYIKLMLTVSFVYVPHLLGEPVITFFLSPYPLPEVYNDIAATLNKPGSVAKQSLFGSRNGRTSGIWATYYGYLEVSNDFGQISFPRRTEKPILNFLFTNKIKPIMMMGNTVHHWELEKDAPAIQYRAERIQDPTTKHYLWDVKQIALPKNNRVELNTVVVFVKPKNVYVPEGASLASDNPNLIMPPIYVKKGAKWVSETFYLLNLKHLFGPIHQLYLRKSDRYSTHLVD